MGRIAEAVEEGVRAIACNPFSLRISQHLGYVFYCGRSYDRAVKEYRNALELDSGDASLHEALGDAYERNGQDREAVEAWSNAMRLADDTELMADLREATTKEDIRRAAHHVAAKRLNRLYARREAGDYVPAVKFAREHVRADDKEQALKWLKAACEERNVYALLLGSDPLYDPLRGDARFAELLKRMRLDAERRGDSTQA